MPSSTVELEIVKRFQLLPKKRLDHRSIRIVNEDHNVRQLDFGVLANLDPWWESILDRSLGCPNQALRTNLVVVFLQIQGNHKALTGCDMARLTI